MKKSRYSETQIASMLKEAEGGATVAEICRRHGISDTTFYNWKLFSVSTNETGCGHQLNGVNLARRSSGAIQPSRMAQSNRDAMRVMYLLKVVTDKVLSGFIATTSATDLSR